MDEFPVCGPRPFSKATIVDADLDITDAVAKEVIVQDNIRGTAGGGTDAHDYHILEKLSTFKAHAGVDLYSATDQAKLSKVWPAVGIIWPVLLGYRWLVENRVETSQSKSVSVADMFSAM